MLARSGQLAFWLKAQEENMPAYAVYSVACC